ncbi:MAG: PrsW family intramembrane metalloprotease [Dehalococcoidia bacterium]|jgi:RsiW-degrading membrane proteinase PrsW (M82 family)
MESQMTPPNRSVPFYRRNSFRVLLGGTALFFLLTALVRGTNNPSYVPTVIVVGAFVVPMAFVSYVYEREPGRDIPTSIVAMCFLWGGMLGVTVAATLEYATLRSLGTAQMFGVGMIEESAKLIVPLGIYFHGRYCSEADGVIFGVAAGMGFAGLETIGYGFAAAHGSGGIGNVDVTLIARGLLSPAGHGAWTGLVCAVLWREREKAGRRVINLPVVAAFTAAVLFHAFWDIFNSPTGPTAIELLGIEVGSGIIALVSLALLFHMVNEAANRRALFVPGCSPQPG